ncbi:hypothetical protein TNCV_2794331 [Trichonephila clavipes]|nr:hypothetical protein TNCV_2794331 [Trichonephila clavipes]
MPNSVYVTLGPEVYEQIFRSGGQPDVEPPVLSSQASLVLIYRPTEGQRCMLTLSRAETSYRWYGVVVRRGGASSGVVHVT